MINVTRGGRDTQYASCNIIHQRKSLRHSVPPIKDAKGVREQNSH